MGRLGKILGSKVGYFFAIMHSIAVVYEFAKLDGSVGGPCEALFRNSAGWVLLAGRGIHWYQESLLLQTLIIVDLPALAVAELVVAILPTMCDYPKSWTIAILAFFLASFQWYFVGWFIENLYRSTQLNAPKI